MCQSCISYPDEQITPLISVAVEAVKIDTSHVSAECRRIEEESTVLIIPWLFFFSPISADLPTPKERSRGHQRKTTTGNFPLWEMIWIAASFFHPVWYFSWRTNFERKHLSDLLGSRRKSEKKREAESRVWTGTAQRRPTQSAENRKSLLLNYYRY